MPLRRVCRNAQPEVEGIETLAFTLRPCSLNGPNGRNAPPEVEGIETQFTQAAGQGISRVMTLPGSFYALVAGPGGMVAAGDVAGFRRLFTARVQGFPVLASHARVLRRLLGAPVDRTWLACRLATPEAPSVLRDTLSPFTGVDPVPAGHFAEITGTRYRTACWWTPPPARLPLASSRC